MPKEGEPTLTKKNSEGGPKKRRESSPIKGKAQTTGRTAPSSRAAPGGKGAVKKKTDAGVAKEGAPKKKKGPT